MFRYVTLTENNTIDKESANEFDGSVKVYVTDSVLSTYLNTPWLCWVEKNADGTYLLHVPDDAPRPSYEQKIADFENTLSTLQTNDTNLKAQLDDSQKKNQALVAQIREMQAQNSLLSAQVAQLSADDKAKEDALNSANAKIQQQSSAVESNGATEAQPASSQPVQSASQVSAQPAGTVNYSINK